MAGVRPTILAQQTYSISQVGVREQLHRFVAAARERGLVMRSVASVCACVYLRVCPVRAVSIERLNLETSLVACEYIFRMSGSNSSGLTSTSREQNTAWPIAYKRN